MKKPICICGCQKFKVLIQGDYCFFTLQGKPVAFQALQCLDCSMVLTNPPPYITETSNNELDSNSTNDEASLVESSIYRISRLKSYINASTKVLEIGCSTGKLVEMVEKMGVQHSVGVEISMVAATRGKKLGRNIKNMYLQDCNFPSNYFDVIQAHHVLEHIPYLSKTLDEIYRILKPRGIFYVTVPRHNSIFVRSPNWMGWFPQEHFWHFTDQSLCSVLAKHGFELLQLSCPLHSNFLTQKGKLYHIKAGLKFIVKKLNMGDTVEAFFIKK